MDNEQANQCVALSDMGRAIENGGSEGVQEIEGGRRGSGADIYIRQLGEALQIRDI